MSCPAPDARRCAAGAGDVDGAWWRSRDDDFYAHQLRIILALARAKARNGHRDVKWYFVAGDRALVRSAYDKVDSTSLQRECSARAHLENSTHASRALREMIARPKISRNEWKTAEI